MTPRARIDRRLRSHRLTAPAPTLADAARHMLALQAQEFTGGRWALAARTAGAPTVSEVDRALERGEIVRAWTMRGTIHLVPAADLAWMLSITAERQLAQAAPMYRYEGIDAAEVARAERGTRAALGGGNRLERRELFAALETGGVSTAGQRGYHLLTALAIRGIVCMGPVVPRPGGVSREQYLVLCEEWIRDAATPADPTAEMFARFVASHGPANARDFAWWAGLPLTLARGAAAAASARLVAVDDERDPAYVAAGPSPRRSPRAPRVLALAPFEEYYLSYADRTAVCAPEFLAAVGPAKNGIVRPVLVADGLVVGVWTHSLAIGRHTERPVPELLAPDAATAEEIGAALDRYAAFLAG